MALLVTPMGVLPQTLAPGTATTDQRSSCEANLTCARQVGVISAKDFKLEVPNLSQWEQVSAPSASGLRAARWDTVPTAWRDPTTGMEFVLIPGACYGTEAIAGQRVEGTAAGRTRQVCIDPFYMGVFEVTFAEYDQFARATGKRLADDEGWGRGRRPAINVSFYDALSFAKWLSRRSRGRYRLPTEVEWEHAARAGRASAFPWGEDIGSNQANCDGCGSRWDGQSTAPVGSFAANTWGLHDVIGNVGEWTCSMRDPDPARSFTACDSPYESRRRVYRNGGWSDAPARLSVHFRDWNAAVRRTDDVGFRMLKECGDCTTLSDHAETGKLADGDLEADAGR